MLKLVSLFTALSALSTAAEASPLPKPVEGLVQSQLRAFALASPRARVAANTCADFSGSWSGACKVKDEEKKVSFTVEQKGCDSLAINGEKIDLGHNAVATDSSVLDSANVQMETRFSQDGRAAEAYATLFLDSPLFQDAISGRLAGAMHKDGAALQLDGRIDIWVGQDNSATVPVACTLTKSN